MNLAAADVACRELGFDFGSIAPSPCALYGGANVCGAQGSPVGMKDLTCTGGEFSIDECTWSSPDASCLGHELDSVVYCGMTGSIVQEGKARVLDNGSPSLSGGGILQVYM